jgi:hypothetical protein
MKSNSSSPLLAVAFIAVSVGFPTATVRMIRQYTGNFDPGELATFAAISGSFWLPMVFLAYTIGARRLTPRAMICFAAAELLVFCAIWYGYSRL